MKCQNCGNTLSCGCQKRVASDGASVCSSCITSYEVKIKQNKTTSVQTSVPRIHQNTAPVVTGVTYKPGQV
jgi:hypothetical protein